MAACALPLRSSSAALTIGRLSWLTIVSLGYCCSISVISGCVFAASPASARASAAYVSVTLVRVSFSAASARPTDFAFCPSAAASEAASAVYCAPTSFASLRAAPRASEGRRLTLPIARAILIGFAARPRELLLHRRRVIADERERIEAVANGKAIQFLPQRPGADVFGFGEAVGRSDIERDFHAAPPGRR